MCGRFVLYSSAADLEEHFAASLDPASIRARYNIAPGTPILAVRVDTAGARAFTILHWGLIPSWAKERKVAYRMINARAETVAGKPAFRAAFRQRRCLIPADGFYEWKGTPAGKQAYFIRLKDPGPLAFAGLWEHWSDPVTGESVLSGAILVTAANDLVRTIHDRMPVILRPEDYAAWLDPAQSGASLESLLRPFAADRMFAYAVDRRVNQPRQDDPALLDRDFEAGSAG